VNPATIAIQVQVDWLRWDGLKYTTSTSSSFAESENELQYVVMYSRDGGVSWLQVEDNSFATPGVKRSHRSTCTRHGHRQRDRAVERARGLVPEGSYWIRPRPTATTRACTTATTRRRSTSTDEGGGEHASSFRGCRSQGGFTLVEVAVVALILAMLIGLVSGLLKSGSDASKLAERTNHATEIAQDLADGMRRELRSAVRLFTNDATGVAYRSRLEDWVGNEPLASSTLPVLAVGGHVPQGRRGHDQDGNDLMFARHAWSAEFLSTSGAVYRYDVYRLVRYFEKSEGNGPRPGSPIGVNLVRWIGEPMVDGSQVDVIATAGEQQQLLTHLLAGTATGRA
jgi:type II secretory pathway pseudopilin PulG